MPRTVSPQGRYWIATLSDERNPDFNPETLISDKIKWVKGQKEQGANGFIHWQFVLCTEKIRLNALKALISDNVHLELSRSEAAESYVWKDESAIPDTRFEHGKKPVFYYFINISSKETQKQTGKESCNLLRRATWRKSRRPTPILSSDTIQLFKKLPSITLDQLEDPELKSAVTGARAELERHIERLKRLEMTYTSRILTPNGGMDTEESPMSSLTSSPASSIFPTCCHGSTNIPVTWKSRDLREVCARSNSGLPPTSHQENGTLTLQNPS